MAVVSLQPRAGSSVAMTNTVAAQGELASKVKVMASCCGLAGKGVTAASWGRKGVGGYDEIHASS